MDKNSDDRKPTNIITVKVDYSESGGANASAEHPVTHKVFNARWRRREDHSDKYVGDRKVYDKDGRLWPIDADYRNTCLAEDQE